MRVDVVIRYKIDKPNKQYTNAVLGSTVYDEYRALTCFMVKLHKQIVHENVWLDSVNLREFVNITSEYD